jgi:hypothetical protein
VILFGIIGFGSAMWKWKIVQLAFGRRLSLFLFHVWRKEPFGEGRTIYLRINKGTLRSGCDILVAERWPCFLDCCGCIRVPPAS